MNEMNKLELAFVEPDFEINGCEFHITKLKGLQGFRTFEKIRESFGRANESVSFGSDSQEDVAKALIGILTKLRAEDVEAILKDMIPCIEVKLPNSDVMGSFSKMSGMVYDVIDPLDIYEILARAVAVNFMESFLKVLSRLGFNPQETENADTSQ